LLVLQVTNGSTVRTATTALPVGRIWESVTHPVPVADKEAIGSHEAFIAFTEMPAEDFT
jgi:hypothetical protein